MAAKDIYHEACVRALKKDGWTITHDPLTVAVEGTNLLIDVGAECIVAAEREGKRIAVEVKSFVSLSAVQDLKEAAGQFLVYDLALRQSDAVQTVSYTLPFGLPSMIRFFRQVSENCYCRVRRYV